MREFITAVEEAQQPDDVDEGNFIKIDGVDYRYYRPTDGQIAMFAAMTGRRASTQDQIAGTVDFFFDLFEKADQARLSARLLDRADTFTTATIGEIMEAMVEEWSGRPTKPSSVSTTSQSNVGRKSTRRTPVST